MKNRKTDILQAKVVFYFEPASFSASIIFHLEEKASLANIIAIPNSMG
jgi:hypothetical protein